MLVSHESPLRLLELSTQYNDYDYALVHLFDKHPEYYQFFQRSLLAGREVLLDNSIFELGVSFNPDEFAQYIAKLKPTFYIVPDVLEDCDATIDSFCSYISKYGHLKGLKIGVIQGKTYDELIKCYTFMSQHADYIAISFDYSWYLQVGNSFSENSKASHLECYCTGRQRLIKMLIEDGHWNINKPHHLLGASLAREFSFYRNIRNIRSCDTSNPVVAGLLGHRYIANLGLDFKPSVKLADLIESEVSVDQIADITYNVAEFKNIVNL